MQPTINLNEVSTLVFKGGGIKGLAYLGAIHELSKHAPLSQFEQFVGTSAGAITAMLLSFRYSVEQIAGIVGGIEYGAWLDHEWGVLRDAHNLRTQFGWCRSEVPRAWIEQQVKDALGDEKATFRDLWKQKETTLVVCAVNVNKEIPVYFGQEAWTLDLPIADCVLASMSIPVVWEPVEIGGDLYVDGGLADNYPINRYDLPWWQNETVLGFWVDDAQKVAWLERGHIPPSRPIGQDIIKYLIRVFGCATSAETVEAATTGRDKWRTVYIDTDVSTLDFELDAQGKMEVIEDGRRGFREFLKRVGPSGTDSGTGCSNFDDKP